MSKRDALEQRWPHDDVLVFIVVTGYRTYTTRHQPPDLVVRRHRNLDLKRQTDLLASSWWKRWGSNPQSRRRERRALPIELHPRTGGEGGIRTREGVTPARFRNGCPKPLGDPSADAKEASMKKIIERCRARSSRFDPILPPRPGVGFEPTNFLLTMQVPYHLAIPAHRPPRRLGLLWFLAAPL